MSSRFKKLSMTVLPWMSRHKRDQFSSPKAPVRPQVDPAYLARRQAQRLHRENVVASVRDMRPPKRLVTHHLALPEIRERRGDAKRTMAGR